MKKIIVNALIAVAFLGTAAKAQHLEETRTATLRPNGSQVIQSTDASGKVTTLTVAKGESVQKKFVASMKKRSNTVAKMGAVQQATSSGDRPVFVRHEAVLRPDGTQEMHLTDAAGKVTVLTAPKGEAIQKTYRDYLLKEGIPCACGGSDAATAEQPKVATLPAQSKPMDAQQKK